MADTSYRIHKPFGEINADDPLLVDIVRDMEVVLGAIQGELRDLLSDIEVLFTHIRPGPVSIAPVSIAAIDLRPDDQLLWQAQTWQVWMTRHTHDGYVIVHASAHEGHPLEIEFSALEAVTVTCPRPPLPPEAA